MTRIVRYALLPALLSGCAAQAQIGDRCNLTPDMDYLAVSLWENVGLSSRTYVVGPDYSSDRVPLPIDADRTSLKEGKQWWGLPAEDTGILSRDDPNRVAAVGSHRRSPLSAQHIRFSACRRTGGLTRGMRALRDFSTTRISSTVSDADTVASVGVSVNQAAQSWLADYYADLEREIESLDELLAELDADPASPATADGEDHYLAVATSPPAGTGISPGESGYHGIGWHTESQHDAGLTAVDERRRQGGGSACFSNAGGKSLRGGCVELAMANWRDRDEDPERTYVVTSSSFRDVIARDLRSGCESAAFAGKYEDTVVEHSCEAVHVMCASDIVPAAGTP